MKRIHYLKQIISKLHPKVLALFLVLFSYATSANETIHSNKLALNSQTEKHSITLLYSSENTSHKAIIVKISEILASQKPDIKIARHLVRDSDESIEQADNQLTIAIGTSAIKLVNKQDTQADKLLITSDTSVASNHSVLYMTQPYCRQINFIKLLNKKWNTIGLLSTDDKNAEIKKITRCAKTHNTQTYSVTTSTRDRLTNDVKKVLSKSDVLFALPDAAIYNRHTVKNILLTSYRLRKPVIGFSKSFVNAGAIAALHSSEEQIALSASELIMRYLEHGNQFEHQKNYPMYFDISINRQVFRALQISVPDISLIKKTLIKNDSDRSGKSQ